MLGSWENGAVTAGRVKSKDAREDASWPKVSPLLGLNVVLNELYRYAGRSEAFAMLALCVQFIHIASSIYTVLEHQRCMPTGLTGFSSPSVPRTYK